MMQEYITRRNLQAVRVTWLLLGTSFGILVGAIGVLTWAYIFF